MENNTKKIHPSEEYKKIAYIKSFDEYKEMYNRSIEDPENFWSEIAENFVWFKNIGMDNLRFRWDFLF